jgi:hypothetical protein
MEKGCLMSTFSDKHQNPMVMMKLQKFKSQKDSRHHGNEGELPKQALVNALLQRLALQEVAMWNVSRAKGGALVTFACLMQ